MILGEIRSSMGIPEGLLEFSVKGYSNQNKYLKGQDSLRAWFLRSFGHQGALYYVFLASDPLKTSCEYAVFTLHTRGPNVCTRETSRQTQSVSAFLFWLCQMIALLHTSRGKLAARTKFHIVLWKTKGLARMVTSKILCKRQIWGRSRPICIHILLC